MTTVGLSPIQALERMPVVQERLDLSGRVDVEIGAEPGLRTKRLPARRSQIQEGYS